MSERIITVRKMKEKVIYSERIEWCDIYKGLLMILVVVGHATGLFNKYIYQFHMAAFFVISGYTSNLDKRDIFHYICDKFYKIMIPFYFLGISGDLLFYILSRINVLDKVSSTIYSESLQQAVTALFSKVIIYCDWLGAIWFLPVLFAASILAKVIYFLTKKNGKWMFFSSVFIFFLSEINIMEGNQIIILSGLAQFYFIMGILVRRILGKYDWRKSSVKLTGTLTIVLCLIWYICSNRFITITVDWPSRRFNGVLLDILLPIFGISVTYMFAQFLTKFPITNKFFSYIGKNTMGIMSFHFAGFKVAYALLILLGCMRLDEFKLIVPPIEIGNRYWFIIVLVSICISLLLWSGLNSVNVVSFLLGSSKMTVTSRLGKDIESIIYFFSSTFKEMVARIDKRIYKYLYFMAVIFFVFFMAKNVIQLTDNLNAISITFPDNGTNIDFKNGWLPQGDDEDYRWVEKVSSFDVLLVNQTELHLEGYVPDNVVNMSKAVIYINDYVVFERELNSGEAFIFDIPIYEYVKKFAENEVRIELDGSRIPKETDEDQRIFSALVSVIEIW